MKAIAREPRGFTLIEMLVVIAIIGILAGMILTAVSKSIAKGRATRASAEARQLATAWESYYREYAYWPAGFGGTEGTPSTPAMASGCTNLLGGANVPDGANPSGANPRFINFFEVRGREFRDPWGEEYRYILDQNFDGKITTPWGEVVGRSVIVWSKGENKDDSSPGAREDDRTSWK